MNHIIECLNPNCIGGRIETTMEGDSGYSNWTVMESGNIEFKCHGCGKFASTYTFKKPNEPLNFKVTCKICGSNEWTDNIQDVDEDNEKTNMECKKCGAKSFQV